MTLSLDHKDEKRSKSTHFPLVTPAVVIATTAGIAAVGVLFYRNLPPRGRPALAISRFTPSGIINQDCLEMRRFGLHPRDYITSLEQRIKKIGNIPKEAIRDFEDFRAGALRDGGDGSFKKFKEQGEDIIEASFIGSRLSIYPKVFRRSGALAVEDENRTKGLNKIYSESDRLVELFYTNLKKAVVKSLQALGASNCEVLSTYFNIFDGAIINGNTVADSNKRRLYVVPSIEKNIENIIKVVECIATENGKSESESRDITKDIRALIPEKEKLYEELEKNGVNLKFAKLANASFDCDLTFLAAKAYEAKRCMPELVSLITKRSRWGMEVPYSLSMFCMSKNRAEDQFSATMESRLKSVIKKGKRFTGNEPICDHTNCEHAFCDYGDNLGLAGVFEEHVEYFCSEDAKNRHYDYNSLADFLLSSGVAFLTGKDAIGFDAPLICPIGTTIKKKDLLSLLKINAQKLNVIKDEMKSMTDQERESELEYVKKCNGGYVFDKEKFVDYNGRAVYGDYWPKQRDSSNNPFLYCQLVEVFGLPKDGIIRDVKTAHALDTVVRDPAFLIFSSQSAPLSIADNFFLLRDAYEAQKKLFSYAYDDRYFDELDPDYDLPDHPDDEKDEIEY